MTLVGLTVDMMADMAECATEGIERYVAVARRDMRNVGDASWWWEGISPLLEGLIEKCKGGPPPYKRARQNLNGARSGE
jgi:hypothetical protein